jgi:hypothetical protein
VGSIGVAASIAQGAFWLLLIYGWAVDELHGTAITVLLVLWLLARFGLPYLDAAAFAITWVAVLDIALVFIIFKGDVPLT